MKAAGRERDIEIAKLKGYVFFKWYDLKVRSYDNKRYAYANEHKDSIVTIKHWSTKRHFAWELWDELPKIKGFQEFKDFRTYPCSIIVEELDWIGGEDFADCVSQAYIIWRQE